MVEIDIVGNKNEVWSIHLFVQSADQVEWMDGQILEFPVSVQLQRSIFKEDGEIYSYLTQGHSRRYARQFDEETRELIEPLIMTTVDYILPKKRRAIKNY
ncbi:MAG: hypothetical protein LUD68_09300 [Rikenellaceae bacterium]|nr:hypothetical protein [Rikenellaceae bacterium]